MDWKAWFRPPRHLLVLFFGITIVSASALGWLSWQLVRQDRALASQRAQDQRDNAASQAIAILQKHLSKLEDQLTFLAGVPDHEVSAQASAYAEGFGPDSALLIFRTHGIEAYPANSLAYYPELPFVGSPPGAFAEVDSLELRESDRAKTIATLKNLSASADPSIRAEALVRLGANFRRLGRAADAIGIYEELARLGDIPVHGIPAGLLARGAVCDVLEAQGERDRLMQEAASIAGDLRKGRWRLNWGVYDVYSKQVQRLLGPDAGSPTASTLALGEAAQFLWQEWQGRKDLKAKQTLWVSGQPVLLIAKSSSERLIGLIAGPQFLASAWMGELGPLGERYGARLALADNDGRRILGHVDPSVDHRSVRLSSSTGLPWNVYSISVDDGNAGAFTLRSQIVMGGVFAIALLVVGGSYLIARAVSRELAVAKLQSDFVSAVSHEFRTPLTAMRQMSELLAKGRVPNEILRQKYYEVLEQETGRLHRLVEGLLKFGRMEAGALRYQFEAMDGATFLRSLVDEFEREANRRDATVELHTNGTVVGLWADREALSCAVWNLLDNAIKYSPECSTVWVDLDQESDRVAIRVRDRGVGIPHGDRERVFQKFVRGEITKTLGVQGTGIGLAVARQIVAAHNGEIRLESEPGMGSTFTILLPAVEQSNLPS